MVSVLLLFVVKACCHSLQLCFSQLHYVFCPTGSHCETSPKYDFKTIPQPNKRLSIYLCLINVNECKDILSLIHNKVKLHLHSGLIICEDSHIPSTKFHPYLIKAKRPYFTTLRLLRRRTNDLCILYTGKYIIKVSGDRKQTDTRLNLIKNDTAVGPDGTERFNLTHYVLLMALC